MYTWINEFTQPQIVTIGVLFILFLGFLVVFNIKITRLNQIRFTLELEKKQLEERVTILKSESDRNFTNQLISLDDECLKFVFILS